ncbi:MAG: hypothetical protein C0506_08370 [Anaerolinea sp.]|nr:hypothetical protein [Anaerolinea sp.]
MAETTEVWVVTGFGCKPCDHVKERLHRLEAEFPELRVTELDVGSDQGTAIALRYKLVGLPGILINGRMALVGDVSEPLLRERLEQARKARVPQT